MPSRTHARAAVVFHHQVSWSLLFAIGWLAGGCISHAQPVKSRPVVEYRTDRFLVQPKRSLQAEALARFHRKNKTKVLQSISSLGLQVVSVPDGSTVSELVTKFTASGLVEFAEPDYLVRTAATIPNDPKYLDGTLWGLNQIDAPGGWDAQTSAANVIVAVLDTGVRYTHQDLASNMWTSPFDQ